MSDDHGAMIRRSPVVFKYIEDSYPTDGEINFTIVCDKELQQQDFIALHTIGSLAEDSPIFKLTYPELKVHSDGRVAAAVIPVTSFATSLPEDGFYHLCYYSDTKLIDASTPFQIRRARAEDLLEVPRPDSPEDDEFVVIKSDKALLQERINTLTRANEELEAERDSLNYYLSKLGKEMESINEIKSNQDVLINQLEAENTTLNRILSTNTLQMKNQEKEFEKVTASLKQYQAMSREKADEFNEITKCKNLVQQEHQKSLLQIEAMKKQREHLTSTLEQTRANFDAQSQLIQDGQAVQEAMKAEIRELTKKNEELSAKLKLAQDEIFLLKETSQTQRYQCEEYLKSYTPLTQENSKLQSDLVKVTEELSKAEARHEKLKARVSAYFERRKAKSRGLIPETSPDAQTIPKTVEASQASAPEASSIINIPCDECGEQISCSADLQEMAQHMETRHNIRLCPFCSQTFDASLSTTERELGEHVDQHLEALNEN